MKPQRRRSTLVIHNSATSDADDDFPDVSQLRPRGPLQFPVQKPCDHCKTTKQRCERISPDGPCRNCIEGGLADTCLAKPSSTYVYPPPPTPRAGTVPSLSSPDSSRRYTFAGIVPWTSSTFKWLYDRFISKVTYLASLVPLVALPYLLFTPIYYLYKSNGMYSPDDPSKLIRDLDDWSQRSSHFPSSIRTVTQTPTSSSIPSGPHSAPYTTHSQQATQQPNSSSISLDITLSSSCSHHPVVAEPNSGAIAMQRQPTLPTYTLDPQLPASQDLPDSILQLHTSWLSYVHARTWEWRVLFAISGFLFTTAPTIFQIQKALADPFSRTLAFLAIFRAIVGLIYAPVFLYYFGESGYARQVEFAVVWTKETRGVKAKWGPWIILSLPASATLWALLLYTLSMLSFIWHASAPTAAADSSNSALEPSLSESGATALRALFAIIAILDLAGVVWAWKWMRSLADIVKKGVI